MPERGFTIYLRGDSMTYESKLKKSKVSGLPITVLGCTNCGDKCSNGCGNQCQDTCASHCAQGCKIDIGMYSTNNLKK